MFTRGPARARPPAPDDRRLGRLGGLHRRRRCCSSSASPGCRGTRPRRPATASASPAWPSPWPPPSGWPPAASPPAAIALLVVAMVIGAAIGLWRARRVEMTGMPELIAMLHSFVGLAAVLVGWNGYLSVEARGAGADRGRALAAGHPLRRGRRSASSSARSPSPARSSPSSSCPARIKSNPLMLPGHNLAQPGRAGRLRRPHRVLRRRAEPARCSRSSPCWRWRWAGTWSPRSAAATCRSSSRCSTATRAGRPRRRASCSATTC